MGTGWDWRCGPGPHGKAINANNLLSSVKPFGTRALVTGASRGIGLAYAQALASVGYDVVLNHHADGERAASAVDELRAETRSRIYALEADLSRPAAARKLVDDAAARLGGLDVVISNAGICRFAPFLEISESEWADHLAVNLSAGFHLGQAAAQIMVGRGRGGRIIYTTSVGAFRSNLTQTHYCASKGGLSLLAQGMALELGPHGITVNSIAPGWIHTDINDAASRDENIVKPWLKANCPAGRLGKPQDLRSAVLFLCSEDSGYVTGSTVSVDGGWGAML
jgi:NAD(P)-dependent dehydrogenase (short-subunit alcohol dehydrogenase family)